MPSETNKSVTNATVGTPPNTGNVTSFSRSPDPKAETPPIGNALRQLYLSLCVSSAKPLSSTTMGPIIGGIVSGIIILGFAIVSVVWYRLKKSEKRESLPTAYHVEELPSSIPPPNPKTPVSVAYQVDPPGYTEKNAYYDAKSPLNYDAKSPLTEYTTLSPRKD